MRVFISYAREDSKSAQRLRDDIRKPGIEPWLDTSDIELGAKWKKYIEQEISESEYFLALISNNALNKPFVQYEWKVALEKNKPFIPIRLDPGILPEKLPEKLAQLQWVDLFPVYEDPEYKDGLRKILQHLYRSKAKGNFEENFSSLGPDNNGWDLSEWSLSNVDHSGTGSQSIYGEAIPNFNTVMKTTHITLDIGNSATLRFYRKLELNGANIYATTDFKAIIDDGAEHVIDEESRNYGEFQSGWTRRTADLSPYCDKKVTLKFVVTATDPIAALVSHAKAWVDDIVISGDR